MSSFNPTVEQRIACLEQCDAKQLRKLVPSCWRPYYPGKKAVEGHWKFYLYDGQVYNLVTGRMEDA